MPRFNPRTGAVDVGRVDGNAAAGALADILRVDVTTATAACRHCGARFAAAEAVAELDDASVVLLCRSCGHTLLRYVHTEAGGTLSFPGLADLHIPRDSG